MQRSLSVCFFEKRLEGHMRSDLLSKLPGKRRGIADQAAVRPHQLHFRNMNPRRSNLSPNSIPLKPYEDYLTVLIIG